MALKQKMSNMFLLEKKNVAFYVLPWCAGYFEPEGMETMLAQDKHLLPS